MSAILVFFHCHSNTGYAIETLEKVFFLMSERIVAHEWDRIHFAYPELVGEHPRSLPEKFKNVIRFDPVSDDTDHGMKVRDYVRNHNIKIAFGFDQPPSRPMYKFLRAGGVELFVSYWGAPMSSEASNLKLLIKRLQVMLYRYGPDHYIFESLGMQRSATHGRGIRQRNTSVAYLGIDTQKFSPANEDQEYPYQVFGIPENRKIFFYSGHMEPRKGVHVLIAAIRNLYGFRDVGDFHLLIFGNKGSEADSFHELMQGPHSGHITFGGYRSDLNRIHRGCYMGVVASTGWDSLTCSAIEMASSGLPLLVSNLPGLNETIIDGVTGKLFNPGDSQQLAILMAEFLDNRQARFEMGVAARKRVLAEFSREQQIDRLVEIMKQQIQAHQIETH